MLARSPERRFGAARDAVPRGKAVTWPCAAQAP